MENCLLAACLVLLCAGQEPAGARPAPGSASTGPATEKRFPPLKLEPGFKATLFACDPLIEYPSVIALGPRPGSVFVAHDYMTGLGTEIVRRDEVRWVEDTDGDGYADRSAVFAAGFNSIQGLAYHEGRVYAMHAPFLTALRDSDGDSIADERRDLFQGLGWEPEKAPDRLHCANGIAAGHDGWLYLALGDRGCDVARPEGDRLVLQGGGILRYRPDGSDLHVLARGLRNIYDVVLDEELNVFVRDNENDGGTYMVRVYHSFFGADHGYPYLYEEHPREALLPLADLGRGSSAGGAAYLETAFPASHRGDLFFCEWGRSVVRYRRERSGSSFSPLKEVEFAAGASGDPYGFKPTDVIVDRDGSLLVADWADDQRPKRGRGRLYRITYEGEREMARDGLDSESLHARIEAQAALAQGGAAAIADLLARWDRIEVRGRLHAVWAIARGAGSARERLFRIMETDPDPRVRAQAVRAIADLADPVLALHRLDAGPGDPEVARRLAALGQGQEPRVKLEVVVALGRLSWPETAAWLEENLGAPDPVLAHAAQKALERCRNWPAVLSLIDVPAGSPLRTISLGAAAGQADPVLVDGLIERLRAVKNPRRREESLDLLSRVHRKPGPWVYWGFRPGPRPANSEPWERTEAIESAFERALLDPVPAVRRTALRLAEHERIPARPATLVRWLLEETTPESVAALLAALREAPAKELRDALSHVIRAPAHTIQNRLAALEILSRGLEPSSESLLVELAGSLDDSPVIAACLREMGKRPGIDARSLLERSLSRASADVRIAAVEALAERGSRESSGALISLLDDREPAVRAAAASALGRLASREAAEKLLSLVQGSAAQGSDAVVRRACLSALARLREPRAVPAALRALEEDGEAQLAGLELLVEAGGPDHAEAVAACAATSRSLDVLEAAVGALTRWRRDPAVARIQGACGVLLQWTFSGPLGEADIARTIEEVSLPRDAVPAGWQAATARGSDARVTFGSGRDGSLRLGYADFAVPEPLRAQFLASSSGSLRVWLNGHPVHSRPRSGVFAADSEKFEADLEAGLNRLLVQVSAEGPVELHARFRKKSPVERHERLAQLALTTRGNAERGREMFFAEKTGCFKCHRRGEQGGSIGPDLTGSGRRFSRIHLIESILEPSRVIAPAFRNTALVLRDGRVLAGVIVAETEVDLTLGDAQGQSHRIQKSQVRDRRPVELSLMPEAVENGLTDQEFTDLIAYLAEEK